MLICSKLRALIVSHALVIYLHHHSSVNCKRLRFSVTISFGNSFRYPSYLRRFVSVIFRKLTGCLISIVLCSLIHCTIRSLYYYTISVHARALQSMLVRCRILYINCGPSSSAIFVDTLSCPTYVNACSSTRYAASIDIPRATVVIIFAIFIYHYCLLAAFTILIARPILVPCRCSVANTIFFPTHGAPTRSTVRQVIPVINASRFSFFSTAHFMVKRDS